MEYGCTLELHSPPPAGVLQERHKMQERLQR